jgi:hypothetical protein
MKKGGEIEGFGKIVLWALFFVLLLFGVKLLFNNFLN